MDLISLLLEPTTIATTAVGTNPLFYKFLRFLWVDSWKPLVGIVAAFRVDQSLAGKPKLRVLYRIFIALFSCLIGFAILSLTGCSVAPIDRTIEINNKSLNSLNVERSEPTFLNQGNTYRAEITFPIVKFSNSKTAKALISYNKVFSLTQLVCPVASVILNSHRQELISACQAESSFFSCNFYSTSKLNDEYSMFKPSYINQLLINYSQCRSKYSTLTEGQGLPNPFSLIKEL